MSGHSKWSKVKHFKGAVDAKRSKLFTKLTKELTVAARMGGGDPGGNPRLRLAIQNARGNSMPGDTIQRAIARGAGGSDTATFEEVVYEGYGPTGVAVVIEALTDNRNRTAATIRHAFGKHNGSLGGSNSVQFMFERKGQFLIPKAGLDENTLTEYALEAGAEDLDAEGDEFAITCPVEAFRAVGEYLEAKGVKVRSAGLVRVAQNPTTLDDKEQAQKVLDFLDALEDEDDVQKVFTNFEISDKVLAELGG
ncbi:MAG: YebC/PmpR family DNA-binding transcriptional regulator [Candidatus Lambdaproteobacteria bacterium]|nr:YebC/PmpR family DNA-binding transcriptional regulator [Candidatus Lambdaproteobacteria bacterium]